MKNRRVWEVPTTGNPLRALLVINPVLYDELWDREFRHRLNYLVRPSTESVETFPDLLNLEAGLEMFQVLAIDAESGITARELRERGVTCPIIAVSHKTELRQQALTQDCFNASCHLLELPAHVGAILHIPTRGGYPCYNP